MMLDIIIDDRYHPKSQEKDWLEARLMRVSQTEMAKSHKRIVDNASRLMRKQGIEPTSVNDVMKKAGLTHGGFYRHFDSKESLVSAALEDAFKEVLGKIEEFYQARGLPDGAEGYYEHYLSEGHVKHPELGCPIAALSMDVARSAASLRELFGTWLRRVIDKFAQAGNGSAEDNRAAAIRKISMLAGAVMIARASDAKTAREVLAACRE
jgi:TetR/AcrR family transcriptional repressor of nem operon